MGRESPESSQTRAGKVRAFFRHFAESADYAVLLGGGNNSHILMGFHPVQTLKLAGNRLWVNDIPESVLEADALFARLQAALDSTARYPDETGFNGGLAGFFGYEFHRWCDPALSCLPARKPGWPDEAIPDMLLCEFADWLLIDCETMQLTVLSEDRRQAPMYQLAWSVITPPAEEQSAPGILLTEEKLRAQLQDWHASLDEPSFIDAVDRIQTEILNGEIYQANVSIAFERTVEADPLELFDTLCTLNPSPFAGLLKAPDGWLISNSPERLVRTTAGEDGLRIEARPIAGTRGRGNTDAEDAAIGKALLTNEKERAEHLMLVDLIRNDLGKVSTAGTVSVDELLALERYSHVTHLVSNVQGRLRQDATPWDVIKAVFPGGTITGCPKVRCIEILDGAEPVPRGLYTGSLGYIGANGMMDFNILIRSLFLAAIPETKRDPLMYHGRIHAGAGIVADSVGAYEYRECLRKTAATIGALNACERNHRFHVNPEPRADRDFQRRRCATHTQAADP